MKQLCYLMLFLTVFSNCIKITLKNPLQPNYNDNFTLFAESFFSSKHNVFKKNHSMDNYPRVSEEKIDQKSGKINLNYGEIEKFENTENLEIGKIEPSLNLKQKINLDEARHKVDAEIFNKGLQMRKFLIK